LEVEVKELPEGDASTATREDVRGETVAGYHWGKLSKLDRGALFIISYNYICIHNNLNINFKTVQLRSCSIGAKLKLEGWISSSF
jgi:hypothetical protein